MIRRFQLVVLLVALTITAHAHAFGGGSWAGWARRGWIPRDTPTIALWYRADLGVTTATGVSQWNDLSGGGFNASQGTAGQQPGFTASNVNFGGKPTVVCDAAANKFLDHSAADKPVAQSSARSLFVVARASDAAGGTIIDFQRDASDFAFQWFHSGQRFVFSDAATNIVITSPPTMQNVTYYLSYLEGGTGALPVFRASGVGYTITSATTMPAETTGSGFSLCGRVAFGQAFTGSIGEIVDYSSSLSNAERDRVEFYLKTRYGL